MENYRKYEIGLCIMLVFAIFLLFLGASIEIISMLIDHECYQLQPNEHYRSSICEKYWFDE